MEACRKKSILFMNNNYQPPSESNDRSPTNRVGLKEGVSVVEIPVFPIFVQVYPNIDILVKVMGLGLFMGLGLPFY